MMTPAAGYDALKDFVAVGMQVLVSDPHAASGSLPSGVRMVNLEELVAASNVVSLHCPLVPETRNLLNAERLAKLQDRSIVINTARAGVIDEPALLEHLRANRLIAGIDCFQDEPLGPQSPWLTAPNTVISPHIGGTTTTAFKQMGVMAAESILKHITNDVQDSRGSHGFHPPLNRRFS